MTGQMWILPANADDFVQVTEHVASYETGGVLHLAESAGTVTDDGIRGADDPDETDPHQDRNHPSPGGHR